MFSKTDIDRLRTFRASRPSVISLYLNTDGRQSNRKQVETRLRDLLRWGRRRIEAEPDKETRKEVLLDLERLEKIILRGYKDFHMRGLAVFTCSAENFQHVVDLPRPPRDRIAFGATPWIRPLQFQEKEYHRFCTVLTDRADARIFLIYQGSILEYRHVADEVPGKVKWGGLGSYEDKRAERKVDRKVGDHFRHVADTLFELFKRDHFEWLIVGCRQESIKEFEATLHPYLRSRLAAHLDIPENAPEHEVLERALRVEKGILFREQCHGIEQFREALHSGKPAVTGLEEALRHLNAQAVTTLLVARDYSAAGTRCSQCPGLGILDLKCPLCSGEMLETPDVVTDAIDRALELNCDVRQFYEGVGMDEFAQIAALLRFKV